MVRASLLLSPALAAIALARVDGVARFSARDLCPATCIESGPSPSNWTVLAELGQLQACNKPMVLDFSVRLPVTQRQPIRVCNVWGNDFYTTTSLQASPSETITEDVVPEMAWTAASEGGIKGRLVTQSVEHLQSYLANSFDIKSQTTLFGTVSGTTVGVYVGANLMNPSVAETLFTPLLSKLRQAGLTDSTSALIQVCEGRTGKQIFGLVAAASADFAIVHDAVGHWANGTCVDTSSYAETLQLNATITTLKPVILPTLPVSNSTAANSTFNTPRSPRSLSSVRGLLRARADCKTATVQSGDSCATLLTKCGITALDLYTYNPAANLCSTLTPGQQICCSSGTLPVTAQPTDGTCRTQTVDSGDSCATLLTKCGMTALDLYTYNPAANLCSTLTPGQQICCSSGTLPVAQSQPNADGTCRTEVVDSGDDCGKLVTRCGAGLTAQDFYKYNPASTLCSTLQPGQRVCCTSGELPDIRPKQNADGTCFAYMIKSGDYCAKIATENGLTVDELEEMNKNTWGWNGCSNGFWPDNWICLSKGTPPFPAPIANAVCGPQMPGSKWDGRSESKNWGAMNPCPLNACCNVWGQCGTTADFCVNTNTGAPGTAAKDTFGCISNCGMDIVMSAPPQEFIKLGYFEGFHLDRPCLHMDASQIDPSFTHVHFAFGNIDDKFQVESPFKDTLTQYQFQQFKALKGTKRIISFGGWTFSAETHYDIFRNGVKAENRETLAKSLVDFVVANQLDGLDIDWEYPSATDLPGIPQGDASEAAPSSYWYLKPFPIKEMAGYLDYIVFMTYDLHGQWDAGNKWASPGCPTGNCLRSHINQTETMNALTMITRAGVPSNKVLVGVSSYGRSFQMVDPSCTGADCQFTGSDVLSYARKGRCTDTAGYISNAEINEIGGANWLDPSSDSRIMVDGDLWVSYMDNDLKDSRTKTYRSYNMGGTSDWAVDLAKFYEVPSFVPTGKDLAAYGMIMMEQEQEQYDCEDTRTGTWSSLTCDEPEAASPDRYYAADRWSALDCESAWKDLSNAWRCVPQEGRDFDKFAASFLMGLGVDDCRSVEISTTCSQQFSCKLNPSRNIGACAADLWNSLSYIHRTIKNYYWTLYTAGDTLQSSSGQFVETFAPDKGAAEYWEMMIGLFQIPINLATSRFFTTAFMTKSFFTEGTREVLKSTAEAVVDVTMSIAEAALLDDSSKVRTEVTFEFFSQQTIQAWMNQATTLLDGIFSGNPENITLLTNLISDGKLMLGKDDKGDSAYLKDWEKGETIQRAYYAIAIPGVWTVRKPAPVLVDFGGNNCQVDARSYFDEVPDKYNAGWSCINGRSYFLAGVDDELATSCWLGDGGACNPPVLHVLDGIDELQTGDKWLITKEDLAQGSLNTYNAAGGKNILDGSAAPLKDDDLTMSAYLDVRMAGLIRIPVCGPEEAKQNYYLGRKLYGTSPNYPCNA